MSRLLLIDNYDSFTWNLAQYLMELGAELDVRLHDRIDVPGIAAGGYDALVISPGPGRPEGAGVTLAAIEAFRARMPILGVCLGHQALAQAHGARVVGAPTLMHGKTSRIAHDGTGVFAGLPNPFEATRYHSLTVERESLGQELDVNAWTEDGVVMGLRHRELPLHGVQFHPESILTSEGKALLANFLASVARDAGRPEVGAP